MLLGELDKLSQKVTNYGRGCPAGISGHLEFNKFGHQFVGKLLPRNQVPQQNLVSLTNPGSTTLRTIFCLTNIIVFQYGTWSQNPMEIVSTLEVAPPLPLYFGGIHLKKLDNKQCSLIVVDNYNQLCCHLLRVCCTLFSETLPSSRGISLQPSKQPLPSNTKCNTYCNAISVTRLL